MHLNYDDYGAAHGAYCKATYIETKAGTVMEQIMGTIVKWQFFGYKVGKDI